MPLAPPRSALPKGVEAANVGATEAPPTCTVPAEPSAAFPPPAWAVPGDPEAEFTPAPSIPLAAPSSTLLPRKGESSASVGANASEPSCTVPGEPSAVFPSFGPTPICPASRNWTKGSRKNRKLGVTPSCCTFAAPLAGGWLVRAEDAATAGAAPARRVACTLPATGLERTGSTRTQALGCALPRAAAAAGGRAPLGPPACGGSGPVASVVFP